VTLEDLLFHLPLRYEDRTRRILIAQARPGESALIEGTILSLEERVGSRRSYLVQIQDTTGTLALRFFHFTHHQRLQFTPGRTIRCFGEVRFAFNGIELSHPDYEFPGEAIEKPTSNSLTPVYPITEGLHQKTMRQLVNQALEQMEGVIDHLENHPLLPFPSHLSLKEALTRLHRPSPGLNLESPPLVDARRRLAFEELLAHHLSLSRYRRRVRTQTAPLITLPPKVRTDFDRGLPFALTGAQEKVIQEILADMARALPMMRLIQGDVGSGKTVVAAIAALAALASGYQVAIMAPTDLLADQHVQNFRKWLEPLGIQVGYISGRLRGEERLRSLQELREGQMGLAVGTHALFQSDIEFSRLGLVIIDEQHRFGVHQRLALRNKGTQSGWVPHQLIMTATPIPRTLAMTGYADLDLSVIDERPPGRTPVKTAVLPQSRKPEIMSRIEDWVQKGRQAYWVCTLIEESEALEAEAAETAAATLQEALPGIRMALVHGRLKPREKEAIMLAFKAGEIDLLVATTVIEVGVDVPNAGLMVIENAERLGLAQLHQLRGRVGRGPGEAHCVLVFQSPLGRIARERLAILRETDDGFLIAEKDLEIRGPGELLGTRQTGQLNFRIADLMGDSDLVDQVHRLAETLNAESPVIAEQILARWLGHAQEFIEA
jgi:ATP-dependent DNA helicase RecG